jgi:hypothetical protein
MKVIKAVCLLIVTFAVLAVPATQAVSQGLISRTVIRDLGVGPFPPPHVL